MSNVGKKVLLIDKNPFFGAHQAAASLHSIQGVISVLLENGQVVVHSYERRYIFCNLHLYVALRPIVATRP